MKAARARCRPSGERVPDLERLARELSPRVSLLTLDVKLPVRSRASQAQTSGASGNAERAKAASCQVLSGRRGMAQVGPEGERGASVAASVAALVAAAGCGNCLVWSKSDAFVTAYQRAAPTFALGYVVAADAADEALARPLRHSEPQARAPTLYPCRRAAREARRAADRRRCFSRAWRLVHQAGTCALGEPGG